MEPVIPGGDDHHDSGGREGVNIPSGVYLRRTSTNSSVSSTSSSSTDNHRHLDEFFERNERIENDESTFVPKEFITHQSKTSEETLESLPPGFFEHDFDPVSHLLRALPADKRGPDMVQWLQLEISQKDIAQDVVKEKITDKILAKYDTFLRGMRQIQDVDRDLKIASGVIARGKSSVSRSHSSLVNDTLTIPFKRRRQERLKVVENIVRSIRGTANVEDDIKRWIRQKNYPAAVKTLTTTWEALNGPLAAKLNVLGGLRKRFPGFVSSLRMSVDAQLQSMCVRFDAGTYDSIIRAYCLLDRHFSSLKKEREERRETKYGDGSSGEADVAGGKETLRTVTFEVTIPAGLMPGQKFAVVFPRGRRTIMCPEGKKGGDRLSVTNLGDDESGSGEGDIGAVSGIAQQMQSNFTHAIMKRSKDIVLSELEAQEGSTKEGTTYRELCAALRPTAVLSALERLFEAMCEILHNHYLLTQWHRDPFNPENVSVAYLHRCSVWSDEECTDDESLGFDAKEISKLQKVSRGLKMGRKVLWHHMQARIAEFLEAAPVCARGTSLRYLAEIVCTCSIFVRIGEDFSRETSQAMTNAISALTKRYVTTFHESNLRKLKIGLENDDWGRLPIDLDALGGVGKVVLSRWAPEMSQMSSSPWLQRWGLRSPDEQSKALESFALLGNPFSAHFAGDDSGKEAKEAILRRLSIDKEETTEGGEIGETITKVGGGDVSGGGGRGASDDDGREGKAREEVDSDDEVADTEWRNLTNVSAVTTTALNVFAKSVGRYVHALELLAPIRTFTFDRLVEFFEYYVYFVFSVFVSEEVRKEMVCDGSRAASKSFDTTWSFLATEMRRICDTNGKTNASVGTAAPSSMVLLNDAKSCFGLSARATAADSLVFLVQVFRCFRRKLLGLVPSSAQNSCRDFYERQPKIVANLRSFIFANVTPQLFTLKAVDKIAAVRWDRTKGSSDHSKYVTEIVGQLRDLWLRLEALHTAAHLLPSEADIVWAYAFAIVMTQIVDGFARTSRKCSTSGRELMTMDIAALQRGTRKIHLLPASLPRHCRSRKYAQDYVQSYYLDTPDDLLQWIRARSSVYGVNHMRTLAQCAVATTKFSKRELRRFLEKVEAVYK
eukprot:g4157.t1